MATFRNDKDVLAVVQASFDAAQAATQFPRNPHIRSSTMWEAWEAGWHMWKRGAVKPVKARATRGGIAMQTPDNDWKLTVTYGKEITHSRLDRL